MRRADWNALDASERSSLLRRPAQVQAPETAAAVRTIIEAVRRGGDAALREYTAKFDRIELEDFLVSEAEFAAATTALPLRLCAAINEAALRIRRFHEAGSIREFEIDTAPGVTCGRILRAIPRVGLYVPAGSAPLPSTAYAAE